MKETTVSRFFIISVNPNKEVWVVVGGEIIIFAKFYNYLWMLVD